MTKGKGFSLIELMVAVAIVGILAAIAYPSYTDYILRGRLTDATTGLQEMRVRMEQFFLDNRTYVGAGLGGCGATGPTSTAFTFGCAATAATYTITATGNPAGGVPATYSYTITQANVRGSNTPWGNNATCWVIRKGGGC